MTLCLHSSHCDTWWQSGGTRLYPAPRREHLANALLEKGVWNFYTLPIEVFPEQTLHGCNCVITFMASHSRSMIQYVEGK